MKNTKPVKIKLVIKAGRFGHSTMSLEIRQNGTPLACYGVDQFPEHPEHIEFDCDLPLHLEFVVDGKNVHDTLVGENGEILEDKCIVVEQMCIDGIWLKKWYLESRGFEFVTFDGVTRHTNYFGSNGKAEFRIPYQDLLEFWLDTLLVDN